jgi:Tol biopolymer transport system component
LDGPANERSGRSNTVSVSPDGQQVVFDSYATNLGPSDANGAQDVYQWRARP